MHHLIMALLCHAPDYVDLFMKELDHKLGNESPIPLIDSITSIPNSNNDNELYILNWSIYRFCVFFVFLPYKDDIDVHLYLPDLPFIHIFFRYFYRFFGPI